MKVEPHLVILGAGPQQQKVYEIANSMGIAVIGVDANFDAISKPFCDYFVYQ